MSKKISTLLFASFFAVLSYAQSNIPQLVSFSAVVRDADNQPLVNTPVSIRLTFKEGGQNGPLVYCALHQNTSNQNGFISLQLNRDVLGTGCNGAPSTAFENIPWENGGFWMEVEYQTTPGLPFVNLGQLELASSFYAFAAVTAERIAGFELSGANDGDVLTYNISTQQWEAMPPSGDGSGFSGDYNDLTNLPDLNAINTDNQQLSVSATGDTLYLQNGGFVIIPGISAANTPVGTGWLNPNLTYGSMTDQDGNTYATILIGTQEWMAENLRTTTYANGDPIPNVTNNTQWSNLTTGAWSHYNNDSQYENPYGKLYNWFTVADPRNVCPTGWHVPSDAELSTFINYLDPNADGGSDSPNTAGGKMKSTGTQYWQSPNTDATNESGFSGLPGGSRNIYGSFGSFGDYASWWSSTEATTTSVWNRGLTYANGWVSRTNFFKRYGYSVRCIKDMPPPAGAIGALDCTGATTTGTLIANNAASGVSTSVPYTGGNGGTHNGQTVTSTGVTGLTATLAAGNFANGAGGLTYSITGTPSAIGTASFALNIGGQSCSLDISVSSGGGGIVSNPGSGVTFNGYTYSSIVLGNGQEWMAENLRTTTYANGDPIPNVTDGNQWANLTTGAWVHYNNDSQYENPYGKLYNWYTVGDPRNVCPTGWHVPSDAEWIVLTDYLGGQSVAGGKMKSTGTQYWISPNYYATNESGFSGLPGGYRLGIGTFLHVGNYGYWWSSTESGTSGAWGFYLSSENGVVNGNYGNKEDGFSVRCLRD